MADKLTLTTIQNKTSDHMDCYQTEQDKAEKDKIRAAYNEWLQGALDDCHQGY